jgi:hypothetical protein
MGTPIVIASKAKQSILFLRPSMEAQNCFATLSRAPRNEAYNGGGRDAEGSGGGGEGGGRRDRSRQAPALRPATIQ